MATISRLNSISCKKYEIINNTVTINISHNNGTTAQWTLYIDGSSVQTFTLSANSTTYTFKTLGIHEIYIQDTYYNIKSNVVKISIMNNTLGNKLRYLIETTFSNKNNDNDRICQVINEEYEYTNGKIEIS